MILFICERVCVRLCVRVCACACYCKGERRRGEKVSERELEREGGSLSANTGHEKCMEVVGVSLLERELQRKRVQTGVSELSLSLSHPAGPVAFSHAASLHTSCSTLARPVLYICFLSLLHCVVSADWEQSIPRIFMGRSPSYMFCSTERKTRGGNPIPTVSSLVYTCTCGFLNCVSTRGVVRPVLGRPSYVSHQ